MGPLSTPLRPDPQTLKRMELGGIRDGREAARRESSIRRKRWPITLSSWLMRIQYDREPQSARRSQVTLSQAVV